MIYEAIDLLMERKPLSVRRFTHAVPFKNIKLMDYYALLSNAKQIARSTT